MSGRKKQKQKKPTHTERLENLEDKIQRILDQMEMNAQSDKALSVDSSRQQVSTSDTHTGTARDTADNTGINQTPGRNSRPRTRATGRDIMGAEENAEIRNYTPRNRQRARTSTPHHRRLQSRSSSADCTPTTRPTRQATFCSQQLLRTEHASYSRL